MIEGLAKLTAAAHNHGAKIAVQLYHGGREARFLKTKKLLPLAPSVVADDPFYKSPCREITEDEISDVIESFGHAARRAREAGFDAAQIHGAHGFLFSQFLSPFTNRRQDRWGGKLSNRLRLHRDVYDAMRRRAGDDYPLLIKLGVEDGFAGGLTFAEGSEAARLLAETGYDALEISSGVRGKAYEGTEYRTKIKREREGYFRLWATEIKKRVNVPVIAVGGFRKPVMMEQILADGGADLVALCRPLIAEPDIINQWKNDPLKKPACISCNKCLEALYHGIALHCVVRKGQK
jgi:2,4-dienoyl-CoA reductase-like NADH-dependent reductase (Old Yellow Enzyme family)